MLWIVTAVSWNKVQFRQTMNGGNITVNVAGSVVSQGDLVNGIKNGLATLMRRRGGSQFAVL